MGSALALLAYHAGMVLAMLLLVSHWTSGREKTNGFLFLALGVVGPISGWALSIPVPQAALLVPAALAVLGAVMGGRQEHGAAAQNRQEDAELTMLDLRLSREPDDGSALEMRAKLLERRGAYLAALQDYEAANRASSRNLPEGELEQIRERLLERDAKSKQRPERPGVMTVIEYAGLVVGLVVLTQDVLRGVVLALSFGFLCWLRTADLGS